MLFNSLSRERFGEDVGDHIVSGKEVNRDVAAFDAVPNPVVLDVDVLHPSVVLWIVEDSKR